MPPKKSGTAAPKKGAASAPAHASYQDMIKEAILNLKERNGSSRQAIKKYIQANNNLGSTTDAQFNNHISKALQAGEEAGVFDRPKGPSGPVKLKKKDAKPTGTKSSPPAKPAAKKEKKEDAPAKATAAKKDTKSKAAPKKAASTKKATTAKSAPKKKAAASKDKPKANAGRPRKTAAPAPAVEDIPVVLGKTKSGRVTKTRAPAAAMGAKPSKKASTTKKSTTKKSTPKKATPKKSSAKADA